jgi:hypothetical protein
MPNIAAPIFLVENLPHPDVGIVCRRVGEEEFSISPPRTE